MKSLVVLHVAMWMAFVSDSVTGKEVSISIYPTPESDSKDFIVEISDDDATLYQVMEKAKTDGQMTFDGYDYIDIISTYVLTTIDGIETNYRHAWQILGGDTEDDLSVINEDVKSYVPKDAEFIKFCLTYDPYAGKYVRILVNPYPAFHSGDFIAVLNEGDTLLDVMKRAQNYNKMRYEVEETENGMIVKSIDETEANALSYWKILGGELRDINDLPELQKPVDEYMPSEYEIFEFKLVPSVLDEGSDEHHKYNTGSRVWYSYMIIVTAAVLSVYIA